MISTLIRGNSISNTINTTRYREEYLVDTETNEIIYPKVLPSSITNPPNGDTNIPNIIGGGIDPANYYKRVIDLGGKDVRLASSYSEVVELPYNGIVAIHALLYPNGSNFGNVTNTECSITIYALREDGTTYDQASTYTHIINAVGCWAPYSVTSILPIINKTISISLHASTCTTWSKFNSKANLQIRAIKLCDLPESF